MTKKHRGSCNLDTVPAAIVHMAHGKRLSRIEALRQQGINVPVGADVSGIADWEAALIWG